MSKENLYVLSFNDIRAIDLPLVGGKGANLGELTHAGFPIPTGFCVTTTAFQEFVNSYPEIVQLYDELATISNDVEQVRVVGAQVRQRLSEVAIPQKIANAVREQWLELGVDEAYAVRSSATAEDLPDASFAGQQDTYLNIMGEQALLDAIRKCWISLFTDRAILYRYQNRFDHREVYLSVVVQQMVMSDKSGILFTADPLTGHRHTIAIDASYGLGEALVSGLVSPDAYRVDKRNHTIIDYQIADKKIAIYPLKEGGVRQENLNEEQRHQTVLSDAQIIKLADMGIRIEAYYGTPQDIEWAFVGDTMVLLQARPITSLYPIDGLQHPDDGLYTYFSMGHQQNMTNVMSPLAASILRCIIPLGHAQNPYESDYMRLNGGRLFIDITQPLRHPILKHSLPNMLGQFDALAPETLALIMQRPEFQAPSEMRLSWSAIRNLVPIIYRTIKAFLWEDLTGLVARVNEIIDEHVQTSQTRLRDVKTDVEKVHVIINLIQSFYRVVLKWVPYFVAGELAKRLLMKIASRWQDVIDIE
ncbi:MAG: PEP/pyruvate-binding domain-containing protein, partial [Phototrophicaceae bacterium]